MVDAVDKIIGQWQRECPDMTDKLAVMALVGRLYRCQHLMTPHLTTVFARFGLQMGEFDVLATLRRSGSPFILSPTELYAALMITSGTVTHRLKALESRGLVARLPNASDSRSLLVQLTPAGLSLVEEAARAHLDNEVALLSGLSQADKIALNQGLTALLAQLEPAISCRR